MRCVWLILVLLVQDEKTEDVKPLKEDASKALRATVKAGAVEFSGTGQILGDEDPADSDMEGSEWKVSGSIGSPFQVVVRSKVGRVRHEVFHKDGKTVERMTWRGMPPWMAGTSGDLLSALDLTQLASAADKASKAKSHKDEKVGETECRVLELELGADAVRSYAEEDEEGGFEEGMTVDGVELRVWIGKTDGLICKMTFTVDRSYDDGGGQTYNAKNTFTLTFAKPGTAKVEFPADILKEFEE